MCTHVPGECLAIAQGTREELKKLLHEWDIPGRVEILPLLPEGQEYRSDLALPFANHHFVHVVDVPEGLEILAVSRLSAAFQDLLSKRRAIVELHMNLPLSAQPARRPRDELSALGQHMAERLRRFVGGLPMRANAWRPIGLLDTGISTSRLRVRLRRRITRDYMAAPGMFGSVIAGDHDLQGHGTQVFRILDESLPDQVPIVSGRIAAQDESGITVLRIATAYAHMVATDDPSVINLSLAPRDDLVICPHCRRAIPVEAFHSLILPYVFQLTWKRTLTIMAAGNQGQIANARHAFAATDGLTLVEASNSSGERAAYSNSVDSQFASVARVFGGDGDDAKHPQRMFRGIEGSFGTSLASPFVSVAAYAWRLKYADDLPLNSVVLPTHDFGRFCHYDLGVPIDFHSGPPAKGPVPVAAAVPPAV